MPDEIHPCEFKISSSFSTTAGSGRRTPKMAAQGNSRSGAGRQKDSTLPFDLLLLAKNCPRASAYARLFQTGVSLDCLNFRLQKFLIIIHRLGNSQNFGQKTHAKTSKNAYEHANFIEPNVYHNLLYMLQSQ
jgi:hypothetical protein